MRLLFLFISAFTFEVVALTGFVIELGIDILEKSCSLVTGACCREGTAVVPKRVFWVVLFTGGTFCVPTLSVLLFWPKSPPVEPTAEEFVPVAPKSPVFWVVPPKAGLF